MTPADGAGTAFDGTGDNTDGAAQPACCRRSTR